MGICDQLSEVALDTLDLACNRGDPDPPMTVLAELPTSARFFLISMMGEREKRIQVADAVSLEQHDRERHRTGEE